MSIAKTQLGKVVHCFDSQRIPLSSRERVKIWGKYPYYGAAGIIDYVNRPIFSGLYLLLAEDGSVTNEDGTPVVQLVNGEFWVNNHAHVLRGDSDEDTKYLYYALKTLNISAYVTGAVQPKLNQENMNRLDIFYPEESLRMLISGVLSALDDKIELNRRMNHTLEQLAQALFKHMFVNNSECEKWDVKTLDYVCGFEYGKALKETSRVSGIIPVYGSNGHIGFHNEFLVKGPGIVVGRKGNPGIVTFVHTDFFPIDTTFYVVPKNNSSFYWLFFTLSDLNLPNLGADSAVPGLNRNIAYMSLVAVPPQDLCYEFENLIKPLFEKIQVNNKETQTLAELRDTLLPKLMSGQVRVKI